VTGGRKPGEKPAQFHASNPHNSSRPSPRGALVSTYQKATIMGLFTTSKPPTGRPVGQAPLASGRRLRSRLAPRECARLLEEIFSTYRSPVHQGMPLLAPAGVRWTAAEGKPARRLSGFDRNTRFLLITLGEAADGTTHIGIFTLGTDGDPVRRPVIDDWNARDPSLTTAGIWPESTAWLTRPPLSDRYIDDILAAAGYPTTPRNQLRIADLVFRMMLLKCEEFIQARESQAVAREFTKTQQARADWSSSPVSPHRALLQAVAEWDTDFLPYLQDVPLRMRSVALNAAAIKHGKQEIWHQLDVTG
jgi:hypothetical protein